MGSLKEWSQLLGFQAVPKKKFQSPFRPDKKSNCSIILSRHGHYIMCDPVDDRVNYKTAWTAAKNLGLKLVKDTSIIKPAYQEKYNFTFATRKWALKDKPFWGIGGITCKLLIQEKLTPIRQYILTKQSRSLIFRPKYGYLDVVNNKGKIYCPAQEVKIPYSKHSITDWGGSLSNSSKELLIITKNKKTHLLFLVAGLNSYYLPSESVVPKNLIEISTWYQEVLLHVDPDSRGLETLKLFQKANSKIKGLLLPKEQDYTNAFGKETACTDVYDYIYTGVFKDTLEIIKKYA